MEGHDWMAGLPLSGPCTYDQASTTPGSHPNSGNQVRHGIDQVPIVKEGASQETSQQINELIPRSCLACPKVMTAGGKVNQGSMIEPSWEQRQLLNITELPGGLARKVISQLRIKRREGKSHTTSRRWKKIPCSQRIHR